MLGVCYKPDIKHWTASTCFNSSQCFLSKAYTDTVGSSVNHKVQREDYFTLFGKCQSLVLLDLQTESGAETRPSRLNTFFEDGVAKEGRPEFIL